MRSMRMLAIVLLLSVALICGGSQKRAEAYYGMSGLSGMYGLGMYGGMLGGMYGGMLGGMYGMGLYGGMMGGMYGGMMGGMYGGMMGGMYGGMMGGMYGGMMGGMYGGMMGGLYGMGLYGGMLGGMYGGMMGGLYGMGLYGGMMGGMYGMSGLGGMGGLSMLGLMSALGGGLSSPTTSTPVAVPAPSPATIIAAEQAGTWTGVWTAAGVSGPITLNLITDPLFGTLSGYVQLLGNPYLGTLVAVTGTVLNSQIYIEGSGLGIGSQNIAIDLVGTLTTPTTMTGSYTLINSSSIISTGAFEAALTTPVL